MAVEELQETGSPRIAYRDLRSRAEELADEEIKEQVLLGIERLDAVYGPDWVDHVDPRSLIMSSGSSCILGQLYGDYGTGIDKLYEGEESDERHRLGFMHGFNASGSYSRLDRAWKKILSK